jgi:hypothetical protein
MKSGGLHVRQGNIKEEKEEERTKSAEIKGGKESLKK